MAEKYTEEYTDKHFWMDMKAYIDSLPSGIDIEETIIIIEDDQYANPRQ